MKTLATLLFAAAVAGTFGSSKPAHRARIIGIESQIQQTPQFQYTGPRDKATKPRNWLEIEAEIEVESTDPSGFIPELEANWFAVILDKYRKEPVRLSGRAEFRNVRTIDGKVFLSAYIEPDTLERLTGKSKVSANDIEGFALTLSGPGIVSEGRHAAGLALETAEEHTKWWVDWKHEPLDGMIVPKSQTPFASLWTDRYPSEIIK